MLRPATALLLLLAPLVSGAATLLHVDCVPKEGPTIGYGDVDRETMTNVAKPILSEGRNGFGNTPISLRIDSDNPNIVKLYWDGYSTGAEDDVSAGKRRYVQKLFLTSSRLAIVTTGHPGDHWLITIFPELGRGLFTFHGSDAYSEMSGWMFPADCRVISWPKD